MITAIVLMASVIIGIILAKALIVVVPGKTVKSKKAKEIDHYESPNQKAIDALEAEIFGVGIEITGLPGAWWKLERGCDTTINGVKTADNDGFGLCLLDADSNIISESAVGSYKINTHDSLPRIRPWVSKMTVDEIDEAIQKKMKEMVEEEIAKRAKEAGLEELLKKYNGKKVELT